MGAEQIIQQKEIIAFSRLKGALWGESMFALFNELTIGMALGTNLRDGRAALQSELGIERYRRRLDLPVHAVVVGDSASVGVFKSSDGIVADFEESMSNHPQRLVVVQTGFFGVDGKPLPQAAVIAGEIEDAKYYAAITRFRNLTGSGWEKALYDQVSGMARGLLLQEIRAKRIVETD